MSQLSSSQPCCQLMALLVLQTMLILLILLILLIILILLILLILLIILTMLIMLILLILLNRLPLLAERPNRGSVIPQELQHYEGGQFFCWSQKSAEENIFCYVMLLGHYEALWYNLTQDRTHVARPGAVATFPLEPNTVSVVRSY